MYENFLNPEVDYDKFEKEMDYQIWKVYNCELNTRHLFNSKRFDTINDCQEYINNIVGRKWFIDQFGKKFKVKLFKSDNDNAQSYYYTREIYLPKWAFSEIVILHELCHLITPPPHAPHGALWAKNYLNFIEHKLGHDQMSLMQEKFNLYKVKYTPFK